MTVQIVHTDEENRLFCGISAYIAEVSLAAGVGPESCTLDLDRPMSAYIALDGRLAIHPGRDTALVWDERHGWSFTVETHSGEDLLVVTYLGGERVPPPGEVRKFLRTVRARARRGEPPALPDLRDDRTEVIARLASYWTPQLSPGR